MIFKPVNEKRNKENSTNPWKGWEEEMHEKKDGKLKTQNKAAGIGLSVSNVTVNMNCICLFHKR